MGWQDAPVVEATPQPTAGASASGQAAWMAAPMVEQPKPQSKADYDPLVVAASNKYGLDPRVARAVLDVESSGDTMALSKKGAGGLMQLMPATAAEMGVRDVNDPAQNIDGGVRYLKKMIDANNGNVQLGLAAYNAGLGNVQKHGGIPPFKETQDYVKKVMSRMGDEDVPFMGGLTGQAPTPAPTQAESRKGDTTSTIARTLMGLNQGFSRDVPNAVSQLTGAILPDKLQRFMDVDNKTLQERVADEEAAYQAERTRLGGEGVDPGRLVGDIVNPASLATGVGGVPAWTAKFGPKVQAAAVAAQRAGIAGGLQPVDTSNGGSVLGTKAQQVGLGMATGPIAQAVGTGVVKGVGRMMGSKAANLTPEAQNALAIARQNGVKLSAGDIAPENKMLTGVEGALENTRIPGLSMSGFRKQQQLGAEAAAKKLRDDEYKRLQGMSYEGIGRLRQLATSGGTRSKEATKIVDMIDNAGTDERAIMKASGNLGWLQMKLSADKLYDDVGQLAGDSHVEPTSTLAAIDRALNKTGTAVDLDNGTQAMLRRWRNQLTGAADDEDPVAAAIRQFEGGEPPAGTAIPNTYQRMRDFRGDVLGRVEKATTNETTDSSKLFLKDIASSVERDMDNFANATPKLREANARANDFYKRRVVPYQKGKLGAALTADDPDQIYGAFIRAQAEGHGDYAAQKLWTALDEKGRAAVRYGIVRQALGNATEDGRFSPAKFKNGLESTEYRQYFRDAAGRQRVDGVLNLMGLLRKASPEHLEKYAPMLGGQLGLGSVGMGAAVAGIGSTATALGGAGFLRWLMTSDAGKRVLFSTNALAKGGSKEQIGKYLDETLRQFNSATATAAGAESGKPGTVVP